MKRGLSQVRERARGRTPDGGRGGTELGGNMKSAYALGAKRMVGEPSPRGRRRHAVAKEVRNEGSGNQKARPSKKNNNMANQPSGSWPTASLGTANYCLVLL